MKKVFSGALAAILTACIVLSSCSRDSGLNKSFVYPIDSDPVCLDPQIAGGSAAEAVINNAFEGLVRLNENGEIIPGVAVNWSVSSDELTYTFELRSNTQWNLLKSHSDVLGEDNADSFDTKVSADDFVFAFRRALDPATNSASAPMLYNIKNAKSVHEGTMESETLGIKALNDTTLEIKLESKDADFLFGLTSPVCMPCNEEFFNATKGKYGLDVKNILCNGPFYVSKWSQDSSLSLKRNEGYTGNSVVFPSSVNLKIDKNRTKDIDKIVQGIYSAAPISRNYVSGLSENISIALTELENTVWGFVFNCQSTDFHNTNIRLALCNAIDKSSIEVPTAYYESKGVVPDCCTIGEVNFRDASDKAQFVIFNESKAKNLMAQGLEQIDKDSISVKLLCSPEHEQLMRKQLQKWQQVFGLSINASIEVLESDELEKRLEGSDFELAFNPVSANDSLAVSFLKSFTTDNPNNIFGYSSEIYDSLLKKIPSVGNGVQAVEGCAQAEAHLMQNGVIFPVFSQSSYFAMSEGVSGIYTQPAGNKVCFINAVRKD